LEEGKYRETVEFRRPLISEIFDEFCNEQSQVDAEQKRAAASVCGAPSLIRSVEKEVKRRNATEAQHFKLLVHS